MMSEVVPVLTFLLPGFVSAAVFYTLTSHPKPNNFGSVVQALMFTIVVQGITVLLRFQFPERFSWLWDEETDVFVSVAIAVVVGACVAFVSNLNLLHWPLTKMKLTRENSYPTEWYSAFVHNSCYVVLHMDDRRLYGWPTEWPSDPRRGHFRITEAEWLSDDLCKSSNEPQETMEAKEALEILIPVDSVVMVEFVYTKKSSKWREFWQKFQHIRQKAWSNRLPHRPLHRKESDD